MRFHLCAAGYVYYFSRFYSFSGTQYAVLTLVVAGVLSLELVNSAVERVVDAFMPHHHKIAGTVKDMAAGSVLVFCIGAVACGIWLFWDTAVLAAILQYFMTKPPRLVLLVLSLAASVGFVFFLPKGKKK